MSFHATDHRHHNPANENGKNDKATTTVMEVDGIHRIDGNEKMQQHHHHEPSSWHESLKTLAGIAGNVLEWYDFAVFGFFSDILGDVFFPRDQSQELSVMESFAVFGGAFLMRPVGGVIIGYIGDVSGRKMALEISIFLMAAATTLMGCLPTYAQIGNPAILLLLMVRMLQGLSVGGQLMSSLVFTVEGHPKSKWGFYGSFVMASGNFGTFLGGIVAYGLRSALSMEQLLAWGWRIPFLSGILISVCGIYLKYYCQDDEILPGEHAPVPTSEDRHHENHAGYGTMAGHHDNYDEDHDHEDHPPLPPKTFNPLKVAFSRENRKSLLASSMVPMVWSGGEYLSFVWMAIFMQDLMQPTPVPYAFGVNSICLLLLCACFPWAGILSDIFGRKKIMTLGGLIFGIFGPVMIALIGKYGHDNVAIAVVCQSVLSLSLACWGAPMCAWLVESFDPAARLTSVSIGYNVAQALAGGMSPFVATLLVEKVGLAAPGILLVGLALTSLAGLWCVAPAPPSSLVFNSVSSTALQSHCRGHHHVKDTEEDLEDDTEEDMEDSEDYLEPSPSLELNEIA